MSEEDPFVTYDAAYVLGILDLPDRRAFELHLQTCDQCVARVASLQPMPNLLASYVPPEIADSEPEGTDGPSELLLPRLLHTVERQRRRRRIGLSVAALVTAAACAIAIFIGVSNNGPAPRTITPVAMAQLVPSPVHATAELRSVAWGTRVDLTCTYAERDYPAGASYELVVVDRNNVSHSLGDWLLVPGKDTTFTGGTSLERADIAKVQITTASGTPLLQLAL
jgi:anti-sigma-K factor RskA